MSYDDYETVKGLDVEDQRSLLHTGDEVERVWAAWALALKFGERLIPEFLECVNSSPSPGTRRHLLVVLAGLGEREILEECAVQDPDEHVRSTGVRYLIRLSMSRSKPHLLDPILEDPSPAVRRTVLEEMDEAWKDLRPDQVEQFIHDPDPEVRRISLARFKDRCVHPGQIQPEPFDADA